MARVLPKNDSVRKLLKHPNAGAFPEVGSAKWPDDSFTHRRLADGDVTLEDDKLTAEKPAAKDSSSRTVG